MSFFTSQSHLTDYTTCSLCGNFFSLIIICTMLGFGFREFIFVVLV